MSLTRIEQETIVNFNEDEAHASVYTNNSSWARKLRLLSEKFGQDVKLEREDGYGGVIYSIPKGWVKLQAPRIMTEEQRAAMRERLRSNLSKNLPTSIGDFEHEND